MDKPIYDAYETCPHCVTEVHAKFDGENYTTICSTCGNEIMLCSECPKLVEGSCDWKQSTGKCSLYKPVKKTYEELYDLHHSHKANCCQCGCELTDNDGIGLGMFFVLDKMGNFYCTNCDGFFEDIDERIFEPDEEE